MEIIIKNAKLFDTEAEVYVSTVYKMPDKKEEGRICGDIGKKTISAVEYKGKTKKVFFVGLGERKKLTPEKIRQAAGLVLKEMKGLNIETFACEAWGETATDRKAFMEGMLLADYEFTLYKSVKIKPVVKKVIIASQEKDLQAILSETKIIARAVCMARDLMNSPPNVATPSYIARQALKLGKASKKIKVTVIDKSQFLKIGMGAFHGVARGSEEPAKLITLEYNNGKKGLAPLVLIGKGITFDSGGISIKPAEKMEEMKFDMSGAAVVLSVLRAVAELKLAVNVVGVIPTTENLPSGKACKPGDILTSMSGKTIEVISTDAEGRLILCDAMTYAIKKFKPRSMVDIATLTGACVIALGNKASGLMGNDIKLIEAIKVAGESTGERVWQLPLWEEYREQIKSKYADIKNTGGRGAGTITAGIFLEEFAGDTAWAHLDIAGTAYGITGKTYIPETGSGVGVRLLLEFIKKDIK